MASFWAKSKLFLEELDNVRDKILYRFIVSFWPRKISPNHLSVFRIAVSIVLFVLLFYYKNYDPYLIIPLFCIGAISDMLDGSVARALQKETSLGAMLDSTADRMLIIPIAIYSLFAPHRWLFLLLILLEVVNMLVSIYGFGKNIFITSNILGKIKMVLQSVVFAGILIFWPRPPHLFFIYLLWVSAVLLLLSIMVKFSDIRSLMKSQ